MCFRFGSDPKSDLFGPRDDAAPGASALSVTRQRLPADIALAAQRIAPYIRQTPLAQSLAFSASTGADVWFKLENQQVTGSFKIRGAFNRLLTLDEATRARGAVTASSGNHGAAVAWAMRELGMQGVVFVPEGSSPAKVDAIRLSGADVRFHGTDGLETETFARDFAGQQDMAYLSPYNDWAVVAGQGSCGVEISRQLNDVDAVFIAVGGGGLIAGVGTFLKSVRPGIEIVSCQPAASAVMTESVAAGRILELPSDPTLSDGTAGGIEADAITFDICRTVTDRFVTVTETEIASAMRDFLDAEHQLLEGAAGVAIAGFQKVAADYADKRVVILICGGNIARDTLKTIL